jgi:hypothetical protein
MMIRQRMRAAWFAPRTFGWGVRPVTWQGWIATIGVVAAFGVDVHFLGKGPASIAVGLAALALFAVVVWVGGCEQD